MKSVKLFGLVSLSLLISTAPSFAAAPDSTAATTPPPAAGTVEVTPPVRLQPIVVAPVKGPVTLCGAVGLAAQNYPSILKARAQLNAAKENITVQKLNEYMPDALMQYQEVMASHNKLTQIIYGSPVFPANPGPGFPTVGMNPMFFSGVGYNIDWAPIDFGLHKARINLAKEQYNQVRAQMGVTALDVQVAAANAFLDVIQAEQQVRAAEENVNSFQSFKTVVDAQVQAQLKPGADAALAEAELANAKNQLFRAQLNYDIAKVDLANALGVAGTPVEIIDTGLATITEQNVVQSAPPVFESVPILQAAKETILTAAAQRRVLDKEYAPTLHFMGGIQMRGAELNTRGHLMQKELVGMLPSVPNYQVALIVNWNFLDWFRLRAEKRVQDQRIVAQQQEYNLVLQNLKSEDARSRARVQIAMNIAQNMPSQVAAAEQASSQAQARYKVGLSSVAQVAESNQVLANSRMQQAVANVAIWRALLGMAAAHGDVNPFIAEAKRVQGGM